MSADVIQARYDDLAAIAARFGEQAEQSAALLHRVCRCADTLTQEGWEGAGALAFRAEMDDEVVPALQRLIQALEEGRAVTLEASTILHQAEEEAAALFQGGVAAEDRSQAGSESRGNESDTSSSSPKYPPPKNMQDLFRIMVANDRDEIVVFKTDNNEYVVTLKGTDNWSLNSMNSWLMNPFSGQGLGTLYTKQLKEVLKGLPDGATVHLAGYSQGGIIAQNLASEQSFLKNNDIIIGSITTFGSPEPVLSPIRDGKINNIPYMQFDADNDPVSRAALPGLFISQDKSILSLDFAYDILFNRHIHSDAYRNPESTTGQSMANTDVPFSTEGWEQYSHSDHLMNDSEASAFDVGKAIVSESVSRPVENAIYLYNTAKDATGEVAERGKEVVSDAWELVF